jgi:hypothetical protein
MGPDRTVTMPGRDGDDGISLFILSFSVPLVSRLVMRLRR